MKHPRIIIIAAMAENRVIGRSGDLPWRLPDEMRYFKQTTTGHVVIMGRRTFESFGNPLPNRRNIVVTRSLRYTPEQAVVAHSLDEALSLAADAPQVFIAGGAEVYREALPVTERMLLTLVHATPEGDTHFPEYDPAEWVRVDQRRHEADDRHAQAFTFQTFDRRSRPQ